MSQIAGFPRLSAEQEHTLGLRIRHDGDQEALRCLVESNLRFVVSYARRYRGLGVPFLDLIHEGNLGLIAAAARFDPGRNVKFITYAVWWIRQALVHALSGQTRAFSLPAKLSATSATFGRRLARLTDRLGRAPSAQEIADDMDISAGAAIALLHVSGEDRSLSDPVGAAPDDGDRVLGDVLPQRTQPAIDDEMVRRAFVEQLRAAVGALAPKEREVMALRYGLRDGEPQTLQQIGDRLQLSRERIRQIELQARGKLRRSRKVADLRSYLN